MNSSNTKHSQFILRLVVLGVALNGLLIIGSTLLDEFLVRFHGRDLDAIFGVPLISGITLLYLSSLLARRKHTAWLVGVPIYAFILGLNLMQLLVFAPDHRFAVWELIHSIAFPALIIGALVYYRDEFTVKSDIDNFRQSLRFIIIILAVTFCYGVAGFMLMDSHDFHQEIGIGEAAHRTIDQFGLTTSHALVPYTRRAQLFSDSLSIISISALAYTAISLFQPLRVRLSDQSRNRQHMKSLLTRHPASSEDFFKLWPHDKIYFFNDSRTAGLALSVRRGVALVLGDSAGQPEDFSELVRQFDRLCYGNDWQPVFLHTEPKHNQLYEQNGFLLQKIGEEAVVDIAHFQSRVAGSKYFRQINNKFTKLGYSTELLAPPHSQVVIERLQAISKDWLKVPGRREQGFIMGYFSSDYMQLGDILVARAGDGVIKAFMNQIPSFDKDEASFDLLRHAQDSPGNINDYLLMNFIDYMAGQGYLRLNLGLCPLVGLDKKQADRTLVDNALRFVYAGDRIYSFSGLHRFKAKYEPVWSDRFVAYRGGIRGFTRAYSAFNQAVKRKA